MPRYTVLDNSTGNKITFDWNGDKPPNDLDMADIFNQAKGMKNESPEGGIQELVRKNPLMGTARPPMSLGEKLTQTVKNIPSSAMNTAKAFANNPLNLPTQVEMLKKGIEAYRNPEAGLQQAKDIVGSIKSAPMDLLSKAAAFVKHPVDETAKYIIENPVGYGLAVGPALSGPSVAPRVGSAAERLYASSAKMPLSQKWIKVTPGKEVNARKMAVRAGLENSVPVSEYGLEKATNLEREARGKVNDVVNAGTQAGDTFSAADLLKGLDPVYERAASSQRPVQAANAIDEYAAGAMMRPKTLTPNELLKLKRQGYKEHGDFTGEFSSFQKSANEGIGHQAMTMLEERYPALKELNKTDAAYIKLKEALEKAVAREGNKDIVGLGGKVLTNRSIPMAVWESTIGHPAIKSRLAIALNKASKFKGVPKSTKKIFAVGANLPSYNSQENQ